MKIKIVFNNTKNDIKELQKWLIRFNPQIDTATTNFADIPFSPYGDNNHLGIDPDWYNANVATLGIGYDIVLFVMNRKQWKEPNRARGWRTDNEYGAVELQIACDEGERNPGFPQYKRNDDSFFLLASHEIMHALYMISGQVDLTHYYFDMGKLEIARDSIVLPKNYSLPGLIRALNYLQGVLQKLLEKKPNPILDRAKASLGIDVSPRDLAPDSLGCAESLTTLLKGIYPEIPIITGTYTLNEYLKSSKMFQEVKIPNPGCIILSVSGTGNGTVRGHVGIIGENDEIYSNDSHTGLWSKHLSLMLWIERYVQKGELKTYYYKKI